MDRTMEKPEMSESPAALARNISMGSYDMVVENYSSHKGIGVGNPIPSEEFELCGHRWMIQFYPEGMDAEAHADGFASVALSIRSDTAVQFAYHLALVNGLGKDKCCAISPLGRKCVSYLRYGKGTGNTKFIRRSELESPNSGFLKDDSLSFNLLLGVFTYHARNQLLVPAPGEYAFFHVADRTFFAANSVLAARWPALLSYLPDVRHLQDAVIADVDTDIFTGLLSFVYDGTIFNTDEIAIRDSDPENPQSFAAKMLRAAHKLELKQVKETCELRLSEKVSMESVASLLLLADECNATKLRSACLAFAAQNRSEIMDSDRFKYLKDTNPLLFLDLAGFGDYTLTSRERVLNTCKNIVSTVRESLVSRRWYSCSPHKKHKLKII